MQRNEHPDLSTVFFQTFPVSAAITLDGSPISSTVPLLMIAIF